MNRMHKVPTRFSVTPGKMASGFTLIEVVLVLAIGGLIFLLAFLAFSQASANRRDTQRKRDMVTFRAAIDSYALDHAGAIPDSTPTFNDFKANYLVDFNGPDGDAYSVNLASSTGTGADTPQKIFYRYGSLCNHNNNTLTQTGTNARDYGFTYYLEHGGRQCTDNS